MGLPRQLKDFNLFNDGQSYMGQVPSLTLPKLSRKMEAYLAAGMSGPVETDHGMEGITLAWTANGIIKDALKQFGATKHNAVQLRFAGAYQSEDDGTVQAVEIVVRGRHKEIDMGEAEKSKPTAHKYSTTCSYYKLTIDGEEIMEFDFMAGIEKYGGSDVRDDIRKAIGL